MPKKIVELKNFSQGITSNESPTDIGGESASYSLNINSNAVLGRLEGVNLDTVLTDNGFRTGGVTGDKFSVEKMTMDCTSFWVNGYNTVGAASGLQVMMFMSPLNKFGFINGVYDNSGGYFHPDLVDDNGIPTNGSVLSQDTSDNWIIPPGTTHFSLQLDTEIPDWFLFPQFFFFDGSGSLHYEGGINNYLYAFNLGNQGDGSSTVWNFNTGYEINKQSTHGYLGDATDVWPIYRITNNTSFFLPKTNTIQLRLADKEWIFVARDINQDTLNNPGVGIGEDVPYEVDIGNNQTDSHYYHGYGTFFPDMISGIPHGASLWDIEVVHIDVNMNFFANQDQVATFLTGILNYLVTNHPDKLDIVSSAMVNDRILEIYPNSTDRSADMRMTSLVPGITNNSSVDVTIGITTKTLFNSIDFAMIANKKNASQTDVISIEATDDGKRISKIDNIFGDKPTHNIVLESFQSDTTDIQADDDKVYIGTGASPSSSPKIGLYTEDNTLTTGVDEEGFRITDFRLTPLETNQSALDFDEFVSFPLHGTAYDDAGEEVTVDPDGADPSKYLDYDYELASDAASNAWEFIDTNNVEVGQIIIVTGSYDFTDNALIAWKRYDYDVTGASPVANELYMYCGEAEDEDVTGEFFPVFRFLGTLATTGGTPAFAYATQKGTTNITKISATTEIDATAFTGGAAGTIQRYNKTGVDGALSTGSGTKTITNIGTRYSTIDISEMTNSSSEDSVSALSPCSGPLLHNGMGLQGSGVSVGESSEVYYKNGDLKAYARHGVFWVALKSSPFKLYRVNLIDFHELSANAVTSDYLDLDFTRIPGQLHMEYEDLSKSPNGIVNVTIADQFDDGGSGPKSYNTNWSNRPIGAHIVGICETFECGPLYGMAKVSDIGANENICKVAAMSCEGMFGDAGNSPVIGVDKAIRLTSGDKVRFARMPSDNDDYIEFNTSTPYEVNMTGKSEFYIQAPNNNSPVSAASNATLNDENTYYETTDVQPFWWNCKVWIMYAKDDPETAHNKWDLFLYNANVTEISDLKVLYMADRTPPYHQAGYYKDEHDKKVYYPREFAFLKGDKTPGWGDYESQGLQTNDVLTVKSGCNNNSFKEWGIYDKSGRWSSNGGQHSINSVDGYPNDGPAGVGLDEDRISGHLFWGHNIGWDIDDGKERQCIPIKNSLHPLVPYSRSYMAGKFYAGKRPGTNYQRTNLARHAVSFISKVHGDFVVQPHILSRKGTDNFDANKHFHCASGDDLGQYNPTYTSGFSRHIIKQYRNDLTLFQLDEWTGHPGMVHLNDNEDLLYDDGNDSSHIDNGYGIKRSRPNFGGPEIEWRNFKAFTNSGSTYGDGLYDDNPYMHSSVNGGYYSVVNSEEDKGWNGYRPPTILNPGKGYYVFINRTWKSANLSSIDENLTDLGVWGFQWWDVQHLSKANRFNYDRCNNRWHNFSNTCIGDATKKNAASYSQNPDFYNNDDRYQVNRYRYLLSDADDIQILYDESNYKVSGPKFSMHKLAIGDLGKINNISPVVLEHDVIGSTTERFYPGYVCGVQSGSDSENSGVFVLINDISYILSDLAEDYSQTHTHNSGSALWLSYRRTSTSNPSVGDYSSDGNAQTSYFSSGSHFLETINIAEGLPKHRKSLNTESNLLQFRAATLGNLSVNTIISNDIKILPKTPYKTLVPNGTGGEGAPITGTGSLDTFINVSSGDAKRMYFGVKDDIYDIEQSGQPIYINGTLTSPEITAYAANAGGYIDTNILPNGEASPTLTSKQTFLALTESATSTTGPLEPEDYYYKVTLEYDNQYESNLQDYPAYHIQLTGSVNYAYITVGINLYTSMLNNMSKRITGISIYRKMGENRDYSLVQNVKFNTETWGYDAQNEVWTTTIRDKGVGASYFALNGISQDIKNTYLHYGLSTIFQGYMFVSNAWHPEMDDIERYIFRSLPGNFFTYNWAEEFVIMPEVPIAMASYNSRLYVWGKNKLYKVNPDSLYIEEEYDGISIVSKYAYVKTEYGLCFADKNNIFLHDGNKPHPIGGPILHSASHPNTPSVDGSYNKLQAGYRELVQQTLDNGDNPTVLYSGPENSFSILLSDKDLNGRMLSYNLLLKRWDLSESPRPVVSNMGEDSTVLLGDGQLLWNINAGKSNEFSNYERKNWDWHSKEMTFGVDTQDKIIRGLNISGTPSLYCLDATADTHPDIYTEILFEDFKGAYQDEDNLTTGVIADSGAWRAHKPPTSQDYHNNQLLFDANLSYNGSSGSIQAIHGESVDDNGDPLLTPNGTSEDQYFLRTPTMTNNWIEYDKIKVSCWVYIHEGYSGGDIYLSHGSSMTDDDGNIAPEISDIKADSTIRNEWQLMEVVYNTENITIENSVAFYALTSSAQLAGVGDKVNFDYFSIINPDEDISLKTGEFVDTINNRLSIRAYIDDRQVKLTRQNTAYSTTLLGQSYLTAFDEEFGTDDYKFIIQNTDVESSGQEYIRPGHYIKINNEVMFIERIDDTIDDEVVLYVLRGRLNTDKEVHTNGSPVYVVSPRLKFASGSKGKKLKLVFEGQKGNIDSIGILYRLKGLK